MLTGNQACNFGREAHWGPSGPSIVERWRDYVQLLIRESDVHLPEFIEAAAEVPSCWETYDRLGILGLLAFPAGRMGLDDIRPVLDGDDSNTSIFDAYDGCHNSLLRFVVECSSRLWDFSEKATTDYLVRLLQCAIRGGADLHDSFPGGCSPFWRFVESVYIHRAEELDRAVRFWTEALSNEGIDLQQYGEIESQRLLDNLDESHSCLRQIGLQCLIFGRRPCEWRVSLKHAGDPFAGIFWTIIEGPRRTIPGEWQDDDEDIELYDLGIDMRRWHKRTVKRRAIRKVRGELKAAKREGQTSPYDNILFMELLDEISIWSSRWRRAMAGRSDYLTRWEEDEARYRIRDLVIDVGITTNLLRYDQS